MQGIRLNDHNIKDYNRIILVLTKLTGKNIPFYFNKYYRNS